MNDPVIRDLNNHLARLDHNDAIEARAEDLLDEHPEEYAGLSRDELLDAAERDLEAQIEDEQIARYEDALHEAEHTDYF